MCVYSKVKRNLNVAMLVILSFVCDTSVLAQYYGGAGRGEGTSNIISQVVSDARNIYIGGTGDGEDNEVVQGRIVDGSMAVPTSIGFITQPKTSSQVLTVISSSVAFLGSNNLRMNWSAPITISLGANPSAGVLSGLTTVTSFSGLSSFNGLAINQIGNGYTLVASSNGFANATSVPFNIEACSTCGGINDGQDTANVLLTSLASSWDTLENNRVVTYDVFRRGAAIGIISVNGEIPTGKNTINRSVFSTYAVTKSQNGTMATALAKPSNQEIIRGDFRSVFVTTSLGQGACTVQGSYPLTLWLDADLMAINMTKCYVDKTLKTLFTAGDGVSWYNILSGGAIKINGAGIVVDVCP